jgi:hypothetical protein
MFQTYNYLRIHIYNHLLCSNEDPSICSKPIISHWIMEIILDINNTQFIKEKGCLSITNFHDIDIGFVHIDRV